MINHAALQSFQLAASLQSNLFLNEDFQGHSLSQLKSFPK